MHDNQWPFQTVNEKNEGHSGSPAGSPGEEEERHHHGEEEEEDCRRRSCSLKIPESYYRQTNLIDVASAFPRFLFMMLQMIMLHVEEKESSN